MPDPTPRPLDARVRRGRTAQHTGRAAEERTLRRYLAAGWRLAARNWRAGRAYGNGELDLVFERDGWFAFVEVKCRRSLEEAAGAVAPAQYERMVAAAYRFLETTGRSGADMRFDLAIADRAGRFHVIENAFA